MVNYPTITVDHRDFSPIRGVMHAASAWESGTEYLVELLRRQHQPCTLQSGLNGMVGKGGLPRLHRCPARCQLALMSALSADDAPLLQGMHLVWNAYGVHSAELFFHRSIVNVSFLPGNRNPTPKIAVPDSSSSATPIVLQNEAISTRPGGPPAWPAEPPNTCPSGCHVVCRATSATTQEPDQHAG